MTVAGPPDYRVAIVGAGPLGLAVAAHLRDGDVAPFICGHPMEFWRRQMPKGMLLRSPIRASSIASPRRELSLARWSEAEGKKIGSELPLEDFIAYGDWFRGRVAPDLDPRTVATIAPSTAGGGFTLTLEDGAEVRAERVVVAAGIGRFAYIPPELRGLPAELVSHSSQHADLAPFAGRHVAVLGSGQSALESLALLHEAGAHAELIFRSEQIVWLDKQPPWRLPNMQAPTGVGGPRSSWLVASPDLFRLLPKQVRPGLAYRTIRPAGAVWLRPRINGVPLIPSTTLPAAQPHEGKLRLELSGGGERLVDHLLLATGYEIDIRKYGFLAPEVTDRLEMVHGYPKLRPGLESSLPGLYFVGAPAAISFGPVMRFVTGSLYAAPAVARHVLAQRQPRVAWSF